MKQLDNLLHNSHTSRAPIDEVKRKGSGTGRQSKAWVLFCLIGGFGFGLPMNAQTAEADNATAAEQFKAFLASPPAIEKFVFRRTSKLPTEKGGEETRVEFYHARWQTNGFLMRQLHNLEDIDRPQLPRTGVNLGLFAGRYEDRAWILGGESATFMTPFGASKKTPIVEGQGNIVNVQSGAVGVLHHALNMGVTKVPFGSFKWQGNEFEASADDGTIIRGSLIQTADGRPKQLKFIINPDLFALLDYSYAKKLDLTFMPDKFSITVVRPNQRYTNTYVHFEIYSLKPSLTVLTEDYFKAEEYITPQNTRVIETWTNNMLTFSLAGQTLVSGVPQPQVAAKKSNRSYLLLFLFPTMLLIAFFLHKQKQTMQLTG